MVSLIFLKHRNRNADINSSKQAMIRFIILLSINLVYRVHSYHVVTDQALVNWYTANQYCLDNYGTNLATINTDADAQTLIDLVGSFTDRRFWIGINDLDTSGTWIYADGYDCGGNCISSKYWNTGEPSGGSEHCGTIIQSSTRTITALLNDIPCTFTTSTLHIICNSVRSFYVVTDQESVDWYTANQYCLDNYGSSLATIKSNTDAQTLIDLVGSFTDRRFWIGINDLDTSGTWIYADGYDCGGNCISSKYWNTGEPSGGSEHCGTIIQSSTRTINALLNDISCTFTTSALHIICNSVRSFYVVTDQESVDWYTANQYCLDNYGSSLATIKSNTDAQTLIDLTADFVNFDFWVGLHDLDNQGTWLFADGYDCGSNCLSSTYWRSGQPDNKVHTVSDDGQPVGVEHCVAIRSGIRTVTELLNDLVCGWTKNSGYYNPIHFICNSADEYFVSMTVDRTGTNPYQSPISYTLPRIQSVAGHGLSNSNSNDIKFDINIQFINGSCYDPQLIFSFYDTDFGSPALEWLEVYASTSSSSLFNSVYNKSRCTGTADNNCNNEIICINNLNL
eukprot:68656_1